MQPVGISLGWNCFPAAKGVELGLRGRKRDGYKTCPFDEMITNYKGVIACLRDDFSQFYDLSLAVVSRAAAYCAGDTLLWNPTYGFLFNHESPHHANLWRDQEWPGGPYHYVQNDFAAFRERYSRRIAEFRGYLVSGSPVRFLLSYPDLPLTELRDVLAERYPDLSYTIHRFDPAEDHGMEHFEEHMRLPSLLGPLS